MRPEHQTSPASAREPARTHLPDRFRLPKSGANDLSPMLCSRATGYFSTQAPCVYYQRCKAVGVFTKCQPLWPRSLCWVLFFLPVLQLWWCTTSEEWRKRVAVLHWQLLAFGFFSQRSIPLEIFRSQVDKLKGWREDGWLCLAAYCIWWLDQCTVVPNRTAHCSICYLICFTISFYLCIVLHTLWSVCMCVCVCIMVTTTTNHLPNTSTHTPYT